MQPPPVTNRAPNSPLSTPLQPILWPMSSMMTPGVGVMSGWRMLGGGIGHGVFGGVGVGELRVGEEGKGGPARRSTNAASPNQ